MQVFVRTLTGKILTYDVSDNDAVEVLKRQIQNKEGIPQAYQRLIFAGKSLDDGQMLCAYGVRRDSTLHLVLPLRGGHSLTGISFSDVSRSSNVRSARLTPTAPPGRTVSWGTNIECRCDCTPGYRIICGQGYGCLDVSTTSFKCPNCRRSDQLIPVTVGFLYCKYRFRGTKATGRSTPRAG